MTAPQSHKLIVRPDGEAFIVSGNPDLGYSCVRIESTEPVGQFRRSWQAVTAANAWPDPPAVGES